MEIALESSSSLSDEPFNISSFLPVLSSTSVAKDYSRSCSKLPMMRNRVELHHLDENQRYRQEDEFMQEYLRPILLEIAEIRDTIRDLAPHLRNSQKYLQAKIFSYARNHTSFSKRVRSLRARTEKLNENDSGTCLRRGKSSNCPVIRFWYRLLHFLASALTPNFRRREKERQKIDDAFKRFYEVNGTSFRLYLFQIMVRCWKLETLLSNLRLQLTNFSVHRSDDNIAGIAAEVRVRREEMRRWRQDFEFVWREAKNVRAVFGLLPVHNCWQAIYNIMIGHGKLNLYV